MVEYLCSHTELCTHQSCAPEEGAAGSRSCCRLAAADDSTSPSRFQATTFHGILQRAPGVERILDCFCCPSENFSFRGSILSFLVFRDGVQQTRRRHCEAPQRARGGLERRRRRPEFVTIHHKITHRGPRSHIQRVVEIVGPETTPPQRPRADAVPHRRDDA